MWNGMSMGSFIKGHWAAILFWIVWGFLWSDWSAWYLLPAIVHLVGISRPVPGRLVLVSPKTQGGRRRDSPKRCSTHRSSCSPGISSFTRPPSWGSDAVARFFALGGLIVLFLFGSEPRGSLYRLDGPALFSWPGRLRADRRIWNLANLECLVFSEERTRKAGSIALDLRFLHAVCFSFLS